MPASENPESRSIGEGEWLGADERHLEWTTRVHGGQDGTVLDRWTHPSREAAEAKAADDADRAYDLISGGTITDDGSQIDVVWRRVGPWCTGEPPNDVPLAAAAPAWTDPATGRRYDLGRPLLDRNEEFWHRIGQIETPNGPMPLMTWTGGNPKPPTDLSFVDLLEYAATIDDVIADCGPLIATETAPGAPE